MLQKLKDNLLNNFDYLTDKKLLVATSGGLDSMVLLDLLKQLSYPIAVAHCNFQLRGIESVQDQEFVVQYTKQNKITIYTTVFDTLAFAQNNKLSTQLAARKLRYDWFYQLLETQNIDYIVTAHHADDCIETFLINLSRGTGLDGLTGIPQYNQKIVRPLLCFSRQEIFNYAQNNAITWREDSSNASDKYLRNKIRHHLVPILKEINPNFITSFQKTQAHLQQAQNMVQDASNRLYHEVVTEKEDQTLQIDLLKLKALPNYQSYLYYWLKDYQFTAWNDIYQLVNAQKGKQIYSNNYRLIKDTNFLIITPINKTIPASFFIDLDTTNVKIPLNITFCNKSPILNNTPCSIFVNQELLKYPLEIRKWRGGDFFYPSGMRGSKKISKYFKDQKFSLLDKENTWLLCSENNIVWVIGHRADNRFLANQFTKKTIKIVLNEK